jgi:hypothetical protein
MIQQRHATPLLFNPTAKVSAKQIRTVIPAVLVPLHQNDLLDKGYDHIESFDTDIQSILGRCIASMNRQIIETKPTHFLHGIPSAMVNEVLCFYLNFIFRFRGKFCVPRHTSNDVKSHQLAAQFTFEKMIVAGSIRYVKSDFFHHL